MLTQHASLLGRAELHRIGTLLRGSCLQSNTSSAQEVSSHPRRASGRSVGAASIQGGKLHLGAMQSLHQGKSAGLNCPPRHTHRASSTRQSHGSSPSFLRLALDCISLFSPVVLGPTSWGLSAGPAKPFKSGRRSCIIAQACTHAWPARYLRAVSTLRLCTYDTLHNLSMPETGSTLPFLHVCA